MSVHRLNVGCYFYILHVGFIYRIRHIEAWCDFCILYKNAPLCIHKKVVTGGRL